tara:strand:- start:457 stop:1089 length:633 start_codon:yes stop_codon:yes gene_type:complete
LTTSSPFLTPLLIKQNNHPDIGYLLVDYPGYGSNFGYPSQKNNKQTVLDAYNALLAQQQTPPPYIHLLGHSIGAAVAIDVASELPPQSLVLISPFTSTYAMSKRVIGTLWAQLLRPFLWDPYPSEQTLTQFIFAHPTTQIIILHGDNDKVVPVQMGRKLSNINQKIHYHELKGVGHALPYEARETFISIINHYSVDTHSKQEKKHDNLST